MTTIFYTILLKCYSILQTLRYINPILTDLTTGQAIHLGECLSP